MKSANPKFSYFLKGVYLLFLLIFLIGKIEAQNIPSRPYPARAVNDFANLLAQDEKDRLEQKLESYIDSTSTQIIIVTVNSLEGAPVEDYAATLGDKWGVGQKSKHNGVVILVSKTDRKGYIATGYGVEDGLNTNVCKRIYQQTLVPNFRSGDFYRAFDLATDQMFNILSGKFEADSENTNGDGIPVIFIIIVAIIIILFIIRLSKGNNNKHYTRRGVSGIPTFWIGNGGSGGGGFFNGGGGSSSGGGFDFGGGGFSGGGAGGDW